VGVHLQQGKRRNSCPFICPFRNNTPVTICI
jgi:hypothetical protein